MRVFRQVYPPLGLVSFRIANQRGVCHKSKAMGTKTHDGGNLHRELPALPSWFRKSRLDLLLVLPFLIFFFLQLMHHQMWRDETNAWALAAHSQTLGALLRYVRYEAHPYLWYLLLWVVSRGFASLFALKWVAAIIGTCIYLILALWSPFSRLEKVLLFCGYYISFEYTVIARMYGVMLLLVLLYLRSRTSQPHKPVRNALWLGLIANADTFGLLLTFALALEYLLFLRGDRAWWKLQWRKRVLPAFAIYIVSVAVSFACLTPSRHVSYRSNRGGGVFAHARDPRYLARAVRSATLDPWYPLDPHAPGSYWNLIHPRPVTDACLMLAVVAIVLQFRREKRLLVMLAFYNVALILFMYLVYMGYSRHYGTMFVAFLGALWIQRAQEAKVSVATPTPLRFAFVPLGFSAWAGIVTAYASWTHPFSQAGAAAQWLRANHYDRMPLAGTPDYSAANVAEYLGRPIYFLDCNCSDTVMQFWDRRDNFSEKEIPDRLALAAAQAHQPFLIFIMGARPLTQDELHAIDNRSLNTTSLAQFTGAEEPEENFFLYKIDRSGSGTL
jgi:hypothetical protein